MGWGYDSYYPPYVPVAERRAKAAKEVAKREKNGQKVSPVKIDGLKITKTFWGNSWCKNLESYSDYANRLPRGRTYARNGSVVDLQIEKGLIQALVSGSELYSIKITINALPTATWGDIKKQCSGQIGSLVELLQGKLSQQVMEIVTQREAGLFPKPREIKMHCSCPDSAGLCKHLAAVLYGIGHRLDTQPELLFRLRHVDHLELIEGVGELDHTSTTVPSGKKKIATADLSDMFGIELATPDVEPPVLTGKQKSTRSTKSKAATSKNATIQNAAARGKKVQTDISTAPSRKPSRKGSGDSDRQSQSTNKPTVAVKTPAKSISKPRTSTKSIQAKTTTVASSTTPGAKPAKSKKSNSTPAVKSVARNQTDQAKARTKSK